MSTAPIRALVAIDRAMDPRTIETVLDDPGINVVEAIAICGIRSQFTTSTNGSLRRMPSI